MDTQLKSGSESLCCSLAASAGSGQGTEADVWSTGSQGFASYLSFRMKESNFLH